jgi:hypothetical protein
MRKKLVLVALAATMLSALFVAPPAANAGYHSIYVTWGHEFTPLCRVAPGGVKYGFKFKATISRYNNPYPKYVRIEYKVTASATGQRITKGIVKLKKKKNWRFTTKKFAVPTGTDLTYDFNVKYTNPLNGKSKKDQLTTTDYIPTDAVLDTANPPFPACT